MTKEEYKKRILEIEEEAKNKKNAIIKEYALSNNPYSIGDIVTDHNGTIQVEEIHITVNWLTRLPECVYKGIELRKDGIPKKNEKIRDVYQSNIISLI